MKKLIIIFLFLVSLQLQASIVADLSDVAKKTQCVAILVDQEKTISFFNEVVKSKLQIAVSNKGKMRMQTLTPFESISIFDGGGVTRFEKRAGNWLKLESPSSFVARKIFDEIRSLFSGDVSSSNYEISEHLHKVILVPKNQMVRKAVAKIEIETNLNNGVREISLIRITDTDNDITVLKITKISRAELNDAIFETDNMKEWNF